MGVAAVAGDDRAVSGDRLGQPLLRDLRAGADRCRDGHRARTAPPRVRCAMGWWSSPWWLATLAANLAPSLVYRAEHGADPAVERSAAADESSNEALALRPANLILPAPGSRIGPLRADHRPLRPRDRARSTARPATRASGPSARSASAGWPCAVSGRSSARDGRVAASVVVHASAGAAIALAVGTVGGLGALLEVLVTPDIRAWNRISVVIAFLSLLAAALLLDSLVTRAGRPPAGRRARRRVAGGRARVRRLRPDQRRVHPRLRGDSATVA